MKENIHNILRWIKIFSKNGFSYNKGITDAFFDRFLWHHKVIRWKNGMPIYSSMVPPLFSSPSAKLLGNSLFDGFFSKQALYEINIALGDVCNAGCPHCSFYESIYSSEKNLLTKEQYISLIHDAQRLSATNIVFVGGEPLMYEDIGEVIASVDKNQSITTLFTNGYYLEEKIELLHDAWLDTIAISIDHYNLKIHDLKRKVAWLSAKIRKWLEKAKKYPFTLVMSVCLFEWEYDELAKYMELAKDLGFHEIIIFPAFPSWRLKGKDLEPKETSFWKLKERVDYYNSRDDYPGIYWYSWISSNFSLGCQGGRKYIYISPYGDALHCDFKNTSYGNIVETPLHKILWERAKHAPENGCSAFHPMQWHEASGNH